MWTINIFPEKGGDTSLRNTILVANKDRSSSNADTRLVNTSLYPHIQHHDLHFSHPTHVMTGSFREPIMQQNTDHLHQFFQPQTWIIVACHLLFLALFSVFLEAWLVFSTGADLFVIPVSHVVCLAIFLWQFSDATLVKIFPQPTQLTFASTYVVWLNVLLCCSFPVFDLKR